jgi:hypothetical protein
MTSQPLTPEQVQEMLQRGFYKDDDHMIERLAVSHELLRAERDEAREWFDANFAGEDDDSENMTTAQMLAAIHRWGDTAWGEAGMALQRQDAANDRMVGAVARAEKAEARAAAGAEAVKALRRISTFGSHLGPSDEAEIARAAVEAYEEATGGTE